MEAAHETDLKPVQRVAAMIEKHAEGLLNFIHHHITNAASEGINSTIQSLKHAARGLVNFKSLRIRILFFLGKQNLRPAYELPTNYRSAFFRTLNGRDLQIDLKSFSANDQLFILKWMAESPEALEHSFAVKAVGKEVTMTKE